MVIAGAGIAFGIGIACGANSSPPPVAAMDLVAQRNSSLLVCVHVNATAAGAEQCEAEVRAVYCGDGGSLVSTGACDSQTKGQDQ